MSIEELLEALGSIESDARACAYVLRETSLAPGAAARETHRLAVVLTDASNSIKHGLAGLKR